MHVHHLICFGAAEGDGNPALVIEGDGNDAAARQAFARTRGTTCVFIDEGEDGVTRVDYFYPHMQSPLCLHATLAVAAVLFARPGQAQDAALAVQTAMQGQRLVLTRADTGSDYFVRLSRQPVPAVDIDAVPLAALLKVPGFVPVSRPRLASVGSPKLLVQVEDRAALYALAPDLAAIVDWGRAQGVNGLYLWCRRNDGAHGGACEGRNFNHLDPALEDSATGVAAGALCLALGEDLLLYQGRAAKRHCLIRTRLDDGQLLVGGKAVPPAHYHDY